MADLTMGFDPSASASKGCYRVGLKPLQCITMESAYLEVDKESLQLYRQTSSRTEVLAPEREAWVQVEGRYYVVGELASSGFGVCDHLKLLKLETLVPKILAMLGAIAFRQRLPENFSLNLGVLLPYGEIGEIKRLQNQLSAKLSHFKFMGRTYRVVLENFNVRPEGFGVLVNGGERQNRLKEMNVLIVMVGYRNASYLLSEKGKLKGQTSDYGFIRMLEKVVEVMPGQDAVKLVKPVYEAGWKLKKTPLNSVLRTTQAEERVWEMRRLKEAIKKSRQSHLNLLGEWLQMRSLPQLDEVILAGGTAKYYDKELEKQLTEGVNPIALKQQVSWAAQLENELKQVIKLPKLEEYPYRLTDLYGYFYYLEHEGKKRMWGKAG